MTLLRWSEEFHNRLLLLEMLDFSGGRPLDGTPPAFGERPADPVERRGWREDYLPPSDVFHQTQTLYVPLSTVPARADLPDPSRQENTLPPWDLARLAGAAAAGLDGLAPASAVIIHALFDTDERLHWQAFRSAAGRPTFLARGRSDRPGARERIDDAVRAFDLAVEAVWKAYHGRRPEDAARTRTSALRTQARCLRDPAAVAGVCRDAWRREALARGVEAELSEPELLCAWPHWADAGRRLLGWLLAPEKDNTDLPRQLRETWLAAWDRFGQPVPAPATYAALNAWRMRALEEATDHFRQAVEAEFKLEPLCAAARRQVDWAETDVLFKVEGPLLAAPLAWLPLGQGPLFRQVASTSSVVSLTLRRLSESQAEAEGTPPARCLSASWLPPEQRRAMPGLARLDASLDQLARRRAGPGGPWKVYRLREDLAVSTRHAQAALGVPDVHRLGHVGAAVVDDDGARQGRPWHAEPLVLAGAPQLADQPVGAQAEVDEARPCHFGLMKPGPAASGEQDLERREAHLRRSVGDAPAVVRSGGARRVCRMRCGASVPQRQASDGNSPGGRLGSVRRTTGVSTTCSGVRAGLGCVAVPGLPATKMSGRFSRTRGAILVMR